MVGAKILLNSLRKTLFDNDWAEEYLSKLEKDPGLNGEADIVHYRKLIMKTDGPNDPKTFEMAFLRQLEGRNNRARLFGNRNTNPFTTPAFFTLFVDGTHIIIIPLPDFQLGI